MPAGALAGIRAGTDLEDMLPAEELDRPDIPVAEHRTGVEVGRPGNNLAATAELQAAVAAARRLLAVSLLPERSGGPGSLRHTWDMRSQGRRSRSRKLGT